MLFVINIAQKESWEGCPPKVETCTFGVPTFTCWFPPCICDLRFSLESIAGPTQHSQPPCEMKVTNAPINSARSGFIVRAPFTHAKHELWIHAQEILLLQLECVILLACTNTSVLFDRALGIFWILSPIPKYIFVGCYCFAFSNHFLCPLILSLLSLLTKLMKPLTLFCFEGFFLCWVLSPTLKGLMPSLTL
jgi:hypothetical protein